MKENLETIHTSFILKIYRGTPGNQFWEEFELPLKPFYNLTSALMDLQKEPINRKGERVAPVVWEQGCLEEVCGSCSMLVDGYPRQACTALIQNYIKMKPFITLAPLTKFPLLRDLIVDRTSMFETLKNIRAWVEVDSLSDRGPGPKQSSRIQEIRYILSTCMSCGCCTEACPQVNERSSFIGPAAISQVRLFNDHPTGSLNAPDRLRVLMNEGGIASCGNAQNCVKVCPKRIPLTESIAIMGRKVTSQAVSDLLGLPDS